MQSNGYDVVINDVNFLKFQGTGYSTLAMCHYYSKYCLSYLMVFLCHCGDDTSYEQDYEHCFTTSV